MSGVILGPCELILTVNVSNGEPSISEMRA